MAVAIKIKGLAETLKKLKGLPDDIKQVVDDELSDTAAKIVDEAQLLSVSSVDFGNLKANIKVTRDEPLLKQVSSLAEYSAYVEFGTGTLVDIPAVPEGIGQYAIQFKGAGIRQVNLPARPFFFPAVNANTAELVKRIKLEIEKVAKK